MTFRQSVLKTAYPLLIATQKLFGKTGIRKNANNVKAATSFYDLTSVTVNGEKIMFDNFRGKKVLIVNTASDCGYTQQYYELQELFKRFKEKLIVLAFPSNDFKEQEKGTDEEIEQFCKINFGVDFPIIKKSTVVKGEKQNAVFEWLSNERKNGWNNKAPEWNFSKYLINEEGMLTAYYSPAVSPLSKDVIENL
jgi:glutathione peroxidase